MSNTATLHLRSPQLAALDGETAAFARELCRECAAAFAAELAAIVLFGSVARGEARPITDPQPSDVDLLFVFRGDAAHLATLRSAFFALFVAVERRHLRAPREINVVLAPHAMPGWDAMFLENVARDGVILYAAPDAARLLQEFRSRAAAHAAVATLDLAAGGVVAARKRARAAAQAQIAAIDGIAQRLLGLAPASTTPLDADDADTDDAPDADEA